MSQSTIKLYHQIIIITLCFLCLPFSLLSADWNSVLNGTADISSIIDSLPENEIENLENELNGCIDLECKLKAQLKLGAILVATRQPDKAIPILETALSSSNNPVYITFAQLTLGRALVHTKETVTSEKLLRLALLSANQQNLDLWAGDAGIALSVISRWQMDLAGALKYREDAFVAYKKAHYFKGQARSLHYIATIHALKGNLIKANNTLHAALLIANQSDDENETAGILSDLANVYYLTGNHEEALNQYKKAATLATSTWRKGFIQANIGSINLNQRNYSESIKWFNSALEIIRLSGDKHSEAEILQGIGFTLTKMNRPYDGIKYLDQSIEIAVESELPMTESYARHFKGFALLEIEEFILAKKELQAAYNLAKKIDYFDLLESCLLGLAKVERKSENKIKALELLKQAIDIVSYVRQNNSESSSIASGYFSTTGITFSETIDLLSELHLSNPDAGYNIQAFDVAQQAKARSLLDMLSETEISAPKPVLLTEVQNSVLKPGELLLEYHLGEETSFVWVVSSDNIEFIKISDDGSLEKNVRQFLPMLSDYNLLGNEPAWFNSVGGKLTKQLLGEFIPEIIAAENIIISADGILHYLPFEVLPLASGGSFSEVDYLILNSEVTYTPSVSALSMLRNSKPVNSSKSLLVGDPVLTETSTLFPGLAPLPFASDELNSINSLLGSDNKLLTLNNATKTNLLSSAGNYKYAHFATHGVFNEESPMYSGLVLSPDEELNSFLSLSDIFDLNLPCKMVTLSACSSALGDNVSGEGVVGLTRGFIYAGAQSVCSTLWDVSGESTSKFMINFYKLLAEDVEKGTALAKTKRDMINSNEFAHPFFWGAFVLSGEN
jgi:CHAT domain-containing protein/Tfp pilus assembly protein PilF